MKEYHRIVAEINLDYICGNIEKTRKIIHKDTKIMAVIKADAYGHGAIPVAKALSPLVDAYGVAILEEAIELRQAGIKKPVLVLGYTPEQMYEELIEYDIMPTISDYAMAREMSEVAGKLGKTLKIHIKLDTGMSRIGFLPGEESIEEICRIHELPNLAMDGIFSHFAKSDDKDKTSAREQLRIFLEMTKILEKRGVFFPIKHISNSAAIIDMPEADLDMVRSGISTYGMYPSKEVEKERILLEPAMSIYAYATMVKDLEPGVCVGYGGTYVTSQKTRVATIPVGYGDGYPRALSNQGRVLIHGQYAPIIGRVCMDQFMVDVTKIEGVKTGDKVVLVGQEGEKAITMEEIGDMSDSFNYEAACDVGKRVPRVYIYQGKKAGTCDYYGTAKAAFDLEF